MLRWGLKWAWGPPGVCECIEVTPECAKAPAVSALCRLRETAAFGDEPEAAIFELAKLGTFLPLGRVCK